MSIKIAVGFEVESERQRDELLRGLRNALLGLGFAPKWEVKVTLKVGNEEIGDQMPLDLRALGVAVESDATPLESYINSLDGSASG